MARLIRIKKWAGNKHRNQFGILFGDWNESTESAFACRVAWINKKTGKVEDAEQFTAPFEWGSAEIEDLPQNADIEEICYQIES